IPASSVQVFSFTTPRPPTPTLFPYTTLFGSATRCWFGGVHVAAMTSDDAIELGQRLDLIDDHAPHLRRAFRRLLRQLEDALTQLVAGRVQLVLHFGSHLLEALDHLGETRCGLAE